MPWAVKSKHNYRHYAIKVLNKSKVVKLKQVEHTNNEQQMLESVQHPFIINLWGTFQDTANLYMVMDFVPGGELFTLLRRSNVGVWHMFFLFSLTSHTEISWSRSQILCSRSCIGSQPSPLSGHYLSWSETRKYSDKLGWPYQSSRLWIRQEMLRYNMDIMRHTRLSRSRGLLIFKLIHSALTIVLDRLPKPV